MSNITGTSVSEHEWEHWLERLYSLRRDKKGPLERPHKPVLLLSIIDLLDRGLIKSNSVPLSDELVAAFRRYFNIVKEANDKPTVENPFYFLSGDGFWYLVARGSNEPLYREGYASAAPSVRQLREQGVAGHFDEQLWHLLNDRVTREQLREALVVRYFPERARNLAALAEPQLEKDKAAIREDHLPPVAARNAAFRRTILEIYDYRCAACGIRVLLNQTECLVEAAHLIPFEISPNDKPTNGMALCPNHHWAMDRYLIAPCPDRARKAGVWRVNETRLDDRIEGQRDLVALGNKPVIPPSEEKFYPAMESLRWREEHLVTG
jgi:putative restriction endonuclease